jgi:hypothetical protein
MMLTYNESPQISGIHIFVAELQTRNYTFTAIHPTNLGAINALQVSFEKHINQLDGSLTWADVESDVYVIQRKIGEGWVA